MLTWRSQEVLPFPSLARSPAFTSMVSRKAKLEQPALADGVHQRHITRKQAPGFMFEKSLQTASVVLVAPRTAQDV